MDDIFLLVSIIALVAVVFFLFKRQWKKSGISLLVLIAAFVGFGVTSEPTTDSASEETTSVVENVDADSEETVAETEETSEEISEAEETTESEEETTEAETEAETEVETEVETEAETEVFNPDDYNRELTYDDLARNPDDHLLKPVTFEGKIIQVMQGDGMSQYRIATNDDYDKVMLIEIDDSQLESRILEDDYIRFYGTYIGEITYESTLGGNITIPGVLVDKFEFQ